MNAANRIEEDQKWMRLALHYASMGRYSTTPNPRVGAVIIDANGHLVGKGWHQKAGEPHAEVYALREAQEKAVGGTCYVTLEPCSHTGRTPPCADALIAAKIRRVVIGSIDRNPLVKNNGINRLLKADIDVETGVLEPETTDLNKAFFYRMQTKLPWVTVKLASSMDGRTALANGKSKWITSAEARADVQSYRAQSCAILTGADTVIADDPQLNVRLELLDEKTAKGFSLRGKQPLRVIVDGKNRLSNAFRIFNDGEPTLVFNFQLNSKLTSPFCRQIQVEQSNGFLELQQIMASLGRLDINQLWVEAGASLSGALFQKNLVNELILYQAPKLLGADAMPLTRTLPIEDLNDAVKLSHCETVKVGTDLRHTFLMKQNNTAQK